MRKNIHLALLLSLVVSSVLGQGSGQTINELSYNKLTSQSCDTGTYTFVVMTDLHYNVSTSENTSARNRFYTIANLSTKPKFILISGDIVNLDTQVQYDSLYNFFSTYISKKNIPIFCSPGNHDVSADETLYKQYIYPDPSLCAFNYRMTSFFLLYEYQYTDTNYYTPAQLAAVSSLCSGRFSNSPVRFSLNHSPEHYTDWGERNWQGIGFNLMPGTLRSESQHAMHELRKSQGFLAHFCGHIHNWQYDINLDGVDYMQLPAAGHYYSDYGYWFLFTVKTSSSNIVTISMARYQGTSTTGTTLCTWTVTNASAPSGVVYPRSGDGTHDYILTSYRNIYKTSSTFATNLVDLQTSDWYDNDKNYSNTLIDPNLTNNHTYYMSASTGSISTLKGSGCNFPSAGTLSDVSYNGYATSATKSTVSSAPRVDQSAITLGPNPTTGTVSFIGASRVWDCSVSNTLGQVVRSFPVVDGTQVDLSGLAPGLYIVKAQTNSGAVAQNIVLE
jgi:hypothetical protein